MNREVQETMDQGGSNRERIEAVEENAARLTNILGEVSATLAELQMALNATTQETEKNRRALDAMRRDNHASLERLETRLAETNGQQVPPSPNGRRQEAFVDGVETSVTGSLHEPPRTEYRRGGRVENDHIAVERWISDDVHHSRSPSILREPQDVRFEVPRFEEHHEAEYDLGHGRPIGYDEHDHRRHNNRERGRGHRNGRHEEDHYVDRVGNRAHNRGPKVDFPKFNGGIHMNGWIKWTIIFVCMKSQERREFPRHVSILKEEQVSGGVGFVTNMTKKGNALDGWILKRNS